MVREYHVLRLKQIGTRLECELTDPTSMQIVSIDKKSAKITQGARYPFEVFIRESIICS